MFGINLGMIIILGMTRFYFRHTKITLQQWLDIADGNMNIDPHKDLTISYNFLILIFTLSKKTG